MGKKKDTAEAVSIEAATPTEEVQGSKPAQGTPQTPSAPEPVPLPPEPVRAVVRVGNGLNLRAGPGPGFEAHEVLPDGMEVSVLTLLAEGGPQGVFDFQVPGWKYIFTGRNVGWVDARFLEMPEAGHGQS